MLSGEARIRYCLGRAILLLDWVKVKEEFGNHITLDVMDWPSCFWDDAWFQNLWCDEWGLHLPTTARRQLSPWVITDLDSSSGRQADVSDNINTTTEQARLHSLSHHGCRHWILCGIPFPHWAVHPIAGMRTLLRHSAERWMSSQLPRIWCSWWGR